MSGKWVVILMAVLVMSVLLVLPAMAQQPQSLTVTAFVENQVCISGDVVQVTLSATAESSSQPVRFRWDFTNNGSFDTPPDTDPTVVNSYPDEVNRTARVGAVNAEGDRALDTVTFATLRCEN